MAWLDPWYPISGDPAHTTGLEKELLRELSPGHILYRVPVRALALRQDCDDVLFALEDGSGRVAVVHLTWKQSGPEHPPWPGTSLYPSLEQWLSEGMHADQEEFHRAE
jgi:hypothetical protein